MNKGRIEIAGKYAGYKLCYIDRSNGGAWFANCEPAEVWGDDWNDAPYEHNCGDPYNTRAENIPVEFVILQFTHSRYETPAQKAWSGNSQYSVEAINHKHIAWLAPDRWQDGLNQYPPIFAGVTVQEFCDLIMNAGAIYIPHWLLPFVKFQPAEEGSTP